MSRAAAELAPKGGGGAITYLLGCSAQSRLAGGARKGAGTGGRADGRMAGCIGAGAALLRAGNAPRQAACKLPRVQRRGPSLALRLACGLAHRREGPAGTRRSGGEDALQRLRRRAGAAAGHLRAPPAAAQQQLLANAQMRWLHESGEQSGWSALGSDAAAQEAANGGWFVVEAYENPDRHRPGHIAIVRPSEKTRTGLHDDGPQ